MRPRQPRDLLAQGLRAAHDAVPRPVRLLHLRQAAGPVGCPLPHSRAGAGDRPFRRGRRLSRGAPHPRRGTRGEVSAGAGQAPPSTATRRPSTISRRCELVVTGDGAAPPHANARALDGEALARLRRWSPSQGMMIETLAAHSVSPAGRTTAHPTRPPSAGWRRSKPPASPRVPFTTGIPRPESAGRAPNGSRRCTRSRRATRPRSTCKR